MYWVLYIVWDLNVPKFRHPQVWIEQQQKKSFLNLQSGHCYYPDLTHTGLLPKTLCASGPTSEDHVTVAWASARQLGYQNQTTTWPHEGAIVEKRERSNSSWMPCYNAAEHRQRFGMRQVERREGVNIARLVSEYAAIAQHHSCHTQTPKNCQQLFALGVFKGIPSSS